MSHLAHIKLLVVIWVGHLEHHTARSDTPCSKGKDTVKKFDGNCRNCGKYDHRTETCWTTCSTKPTEKGQGSARKISK